MKLDKYKNKDRSRYIPDYAKHGKRDPKRQGSRQESRIKNTLKKIDYEDYEDLDDLDLDKFEKI